MKYLIATLTLFDRGRVAVKGKMLAINRYGTLTLGNPRIQVTDYQGRVLVDFVIEDVEAVTVRPGDVPVIQLRY